MKKILIYLLISLTSIVTFAEAISKQDLAKIALDSTVIVVINGESEKPIQFGSGFIIDGGKVVTNHHVVSGGYSGYIQTNNTSTKYKIMGILASDKVNDLVILEVQEHNIPSLPISDSENLTTGDSIYVAGSPLGYSGTFSEGIISSIRKTEVGTIYQITAPISKGSSGGPVLNNEGVVIGISTATLSEGQNINFASPSFYIKPLIESSTLLKPFSYVAGSSQKSIKPDKKIPQEKSAEIYVAFGIKLGDYLNTEGLEKSTEDSLTFAKNKYILENKYTEYAAKLAVESGKSPQKIKHPYIFSFMPTNPYEKLSFYMVSLIDENDLVYKISASNIFNDASKCESEKQLLVNIIKNKYEVKKDDLKPPKEYLDIPYGDWDLFFRFAKKGQFNFFKNDRVISVKCKSTYDNLVNNSLYLRLTLLEQGELDKTALIIEYIDLKLEALKDDIAIQKNINQTNSSGI